MTDPSSLPRWPGFWTTPRQREDLCFRHLPAKASTWLIPLLTLTALPRPAAWALLACGSLEALAECGCTNVALVAAAAHALPLALGPRALPTVKRTSALAASAALLLVPLTGYRIMDVWPYAMSPASMTAVGVAALALAPGS